MDTAFFQRLLLFSSFFGQREYRLLLTALHKSKERLVYKRRQQSEPSGGAEPGTKAEGHGHRTEAQRLNCSIQMTSNSRNRSN